MPNIENYFSYGYWQYQYIDHIFTLTVAAFAAGFVYFLLSAWNIAPRYRATSFLSAVVMISATYEIFNLSTQWLGAFTWTGSEYLRLETETFNNGYRYANWCIDVPMLLTQLLIVAGFTGKAFWSRWGQFTFAGLAMIITGYFGQFYEPQAAGIAQGDAAGFWIWGAISSVFFVYIAYLTVMVTHKPDGALPVQARRELKNIGWLLLVSWTLYPIAYGWIILAPDAEGIVARQTMYTIADLSSKLLYGVLLGRVAFIASAAMGYDKAIAAGAADALTDAEKAALPAAALANPAQPAATRSPSTTV